MPRFLRIINSAVASLTTKFQAAFGHHIANNGEQSNNSNPDSTEHSNRAIEQATVDFIDQREEYEHSLRTLVDWRSETTTIIPTVSQHNMETIYEHDRVEEEVIG